MKLSQIKSSQSRIDEAQWIETSDPEFQIKTLGMANSAVTSFIDKETRKAEQRVRRNEALPGKARLDISLRAIAEVAMQDWRGLEDEEGKPIKFSPATCYEMLRDYVVFRELVIAAYAAQSDDIRAEFEGAEKN